MNVIWVLKLLFHALPWRTACFSAICRSSTNSEHISWRILLKWVLSGSKKAAALLYLAVLLYQYTQPASKIASQCLCLTWILQNIYSGKQPSEHTSDTSNLAHPAQSITYLIPPSHSLATASLLYVFLTYWWGYFPTPLTHRLDPAGCGLIHTALASCGCCLSSSQSEATELY